MKIAVAIAATSEAVPSLVDVFKLRCEARAYLWAAGEYDLHEAVDELQAAAVSYGLVATYGQDAVQATMAAAFAAVRDDLPQHRHRDAAAPIPPAEEEIPKPHCGVARSVLDAVGYLIKQNDPERLKRFLARHTVAEREAIKQHFQRQK